MYNYTQIEPENCRYYKVISQEEIKQTNKLSLEIEGKSIVLFVIAGELFAIGDVCSHDDGPLGDGDLDGYIISCPRHGAQFDIRDGQVLTLPAIIDIPAYPIRVVDGYVEIGIPIEE